MQPAPGAMSMRPQLSEEMLSIRQRLALFHGTSVTAETALQFSDAEINAELLRKGGVTMNNMTAAGVGPLLLKRMGVGNASELSDMGFDALHLSDTKFATEATSAYGATDVVEAFLRSASDAVAIAGSDAMDILGVSVQQLLEVCAGAPVEAQAVLQQLPSGKGLVGVPATTLLDSGLRKNSLMQIGYSLSVVASQTSASADALQKLGFGL